jgi:hypothetical protein
MLFLPFSAGHSARSIYHAVCDDHLQVSRQNERLFFRVNLHGWLTISMQESRHK